MRCKICALICGAALVIGVAFPIAANSEPQSQANLQNLASHQGPTSTQYFFKQPVYGNGNDYFGEFEMCVKISRVDGHQYAALWNVMPDTDQYLVVEPTPLYKRPSGKFEFKFIDNWENQGVGTIENLDDHQIRVELEPTKASDSPPNRNMLRQYGRNVLREGVCPSLPRYLLPDGDTGR